MALFASPGYNSNSRSGFGSRICLCLLATALTLAWDLAPGSIYLRVMAQVRLFPQCISLVIEQCIWLSWIRNMKPDFKSVISPYVKYRAMCHYSRLNSFVLLMYLLAFIMTVAKNWSTLVEYLVLKLSLVLNICLKNDYASRNGGKDWYRSIDPPCGQLDDNVNTDVERNRWRWIILKESKTLNSDWSRIIQNMKDHLLIISDKSYVFVVIDLFLGSDDGIWKITLNVFMISFVLCTWRCFT